MSVEDFLLTHMSKEDVGFGISCASLQRQHHLTWRPRIGKVEELPFVLVALVGLQIFLSSI